MARREADKRGFTKDSGKRHQLVTDGDEDFAQLAKEFLPEATHTLDVMHVMEYVWEAGRFLYREGSKELIAWVKKQEALLYKGKA
ncbi:MAG TPA: transposase, partial [Candidatus Polarisedimenticolia bacterium]|nr:transposase [Candidatus Polarisedimenticolia bacterium]